ncbi:MAG: HAD family hydrolase [Planctomycetales bacterium]|nr:HAD family hydrolase [Planctomycetales bacterium]
MTDALVQRITDLSAPLDPLPTGATPRLPLLDGLRAVVFDVYGTLLISASGDISLAMESSRDDAARTALRSVGAQVGDRAAVVEPFFKAIEHAHQASAEEFPEVEIRDIWRQVLQGLGVELDDPAIERLAVEYECRVNAIWPMPHLAETLSSLRQAGVRLGIVSNAQFFTPLAFPALTGKTLEQWGFDPKICVWSYQHRRAKPGAGLYETCVQGLAAGGVQPQETLYVGNDMRNDIGPAQAVGMRTALFAGDARSLRLREDDPRLDGVSPDVVVTRLDQLLTVVGLRPEACRK